MKWVVFAVAFLASCTVAQVLSAEQALAGACADYQSVKGILVLVPDSNYVLPGLDIVCSAVTKYAAADPSTASWVRSNVAGLSAKVK